MEDALQWSVDFHHAQKGDRFKLLYEEETVECEPAGIGRVYAAIYETGGKEYHSIYFESGKKEQTGYYDLEGRPMNKGFLKAPVKYARISSGYNLRRFHPILKYVRPHFGTDYAAPAGTPILAVGSGTVIEAGYGKGNGNFVKIKHDNTYQTQYLHMRGFAKGIRKGAHVSQGEVIGYVGSTGLATGPHVCFRFWKNGQQVNHLNLKFPPPAPLPKEELPAFFQLRDDYVEQLKKLEFKSLESISTASEPVQVPFGKP
jgi:murein DD-endopeptidase MepM/ murein hydrolase activator NlpD